MQAPIVLHFDQYMSYGSLPMVVGWSVVARWSDGLSDGCRTLVGRLSDGCRTLVGRLSDDCRTLVGQLSDGCRTSVGRLSDDCRTLVEVRREDPYGKDSEAL